MKWRAKIVPILLAAVAPVADAQPLPEITTLVQQAIVQQRLAEAKEQEYVFRVDIGVDKLRKECTWAPKCPGDPTPRNPVGLAYSPLSHWERALEIFWVDGIRVARILPEENRHHMLGRTDGTLNIPMSESDLAIANQRVERQVADAKALRAQGKEVRFPDDPPQILFSRMLELYTFSNPRREVIKGRSTILLDFAWNPSISPASTHEALLKFFSGTVGIDEEDHAVEHVQGRFLANVSLERGNIKIRKGTRVTMENRRVDPGIWLLARFGTWGEARYFGFAIDGSAGLAVGNYRKFEATSRISDGSLPAPASSQNSEWLEKLHEIRARVALSEEELALAEETQARGYWIDPSTRLMWAGKDNGKDVNWGKAEQYCRDLRLAGHSDWRLATIDELEDIFDSQVRSPGRAGVRNERTFNWRVKGGLFLTGNEWSGPRIIDDRGKPSGHAWRFIFNEGRRIKEPTRFSHRALCVRDTGE